MLPLWILSLIGIIVLLKYAYLIIKRVLLIRKINKQVKKSNGKLQYCRHPLVSIFKHDGETDFALSCQGKDINISVITTPFRRVRYHFNNNELLELIVERRGVLILNPRVPRPSTVMELCHTIRRYELKFKDSKTANEAQKYVILHPAPISTSKASGTTFTALHNNDILFNNIRICGLKYFLENLI